MATATRNRAAVSGVVLALEQAFTAIQRKHPSVARNVAIVVASKGRRDVYGYHAPSRWDLGAKVGQAAELLIAAEYLKRPARAIFTTLLHEAVHSSAFTQGISDTSGTGNKYHNRRFAQLATSMGLKVDKVPDARGHATPDIEPETAVEFKTVIAAIGKATKSSYRHTDYEVRRPNRNLIKAICDCEEDNSIRASKRRIEKGIACSECEQFFEGVGK